MTSTTPDGPRDQEPQDLEQQDDSAVAADAGAVESSSADDATAVLPAVARDEPSPATSSTATSSPAAPTLGVPLTKSAAPTERLGTTTAPPLTTPVTATAADEVAEAPTRRLRVATIVWGLMLTAVGVWIIAWASGARIDAQLALICLLAAGGVALLVGSIVSGARHSRR